MNNIITKFPVLIFAALFLNSCATQSANRQTAGDAESALEERLISQWKQYDIAREFAVKKWNEEKQIPERAQWEALLALKPPFSPEEIQTLKLKQSKLAEKEKLENEKRSVLKLETLRKSANSRIERFCSEFPKGGMLHIHPLGTIDRTTLKKMLKRGNPEIHFAQLAETIKPLLYPADVETLSLLAKKYGDAVRYSNLSALDRKTFEDFFFLPKGSHPFFRFEAVFSFLVDILLSNPAYNAEPLLYEDLFARAQKQGVSYLELTERLAPRAPDGREWTAWAEGMKQRYGVTVIMLNAFFRTHPPHQIEEQISSLLKTHPDPVWVGVNIVADETHLPALEATGPLYIPLLAAAAKGDRYFRRTTHAGEIGDTRDVRDALILGAERIGHGVLVTEDPVTLEYMSRHRVPLEANLSSNLRLANIKSIAAHPFLHFLRLGIPVNLSTDDEGIFEMDINEECTKAIRHTDINYHELKSMAENSLSHAFVSAAVKSKLKAEWDRKVRNFERKWSPQLQ